MYLKVDSLVEINNIITGSDNITMRKVNVKADGFNKLYINKDLKEDQLNQIIDEFNEREIINVKFYSILLTKIHLFYDGNGRTSKTLFANDNEIIKLIDETKKVKKTNNAESIFIVLNAQSLQK